MEFPAYNGKTEPVYNAKIGKETRPSSYFSHRPGVAPILHACRVPVARMDRPVFVTAGTADEIVPVEVVERFVAELGAAGNAVRYRGFEGASRADVLGTELDELLAWTGDPAAGPFDADGDGRLTLDDYEVCALRLVQAFGEPPGSPNAVAVRDGYRALWRAVAARADVDADGAVSPAEFRDWLGSRPTRVSRGRSARWRSR